MLSTASNVPTLDTWGEEFDDLSALPDDLRPHARAMLFRLIRENDEWALSRAEIVTAITSLSFRPILEQEARLSMLGLAR